MKPSQSFILGMITLAIGMFLGYLWSPDYYEFVSNGYNFLFTAGFLMVWFFLEIIIESSNINKLKKKVLEMGNATN